MNSISEFKELEVRLKSFIDKRMHEVRVVRAEDSYSWGYKDAMGEVLTYLDDMVKIRKIFEKPVLPIC